MTSSGKETFEQKTAQAVGITIPAWHAIYTRPRHEKAVAKQLCERHIEAFLPIRGKIHRWKDRKKLVLLPLFPSYVFVRVSLHERLHILQLGGVVRFVCFNGSPAEVPEDELQSLRAAVEAGAQLEPHRYLKVGRRVRVCHGPLLGAEGKLIRRKGGHRLVLSIDLIQRSVAVEVDASDVIPVSEIRRSSTQEDQCSLAAISAETKSGSPF